MTFEEVKKDYQELIAEFGHPSDMTGGFVDSEAMEKVILNSTKSNARDYMIEVIRYGFQKKNRHYNSEVSGEVNVSEYALLSQLYNKYVL